MISAIRSAVDITFFDPAEDYGSFVNEVLVGNALLQTPQQPY